MAREHGSLREFETLPVGVVVLKNPNGSKSRVPNPGDVDP